jgi:hypothetical protein
MTRAYVRDVKGATLADYDLVMSELGSSRPAGLICHVAGEANGGLRVIDVWESQAAFERFEHERLEPARRKALGQRGPVQPGTIEALDVHHLIRP